MTEHPELLLSAYLDEALEPAERASVAAHLAGCDRCRTQLDELRATSRLIAALPLRVPSRSLVPRLDRAPVWLRPVRLLGVIGSGLFGFLFLASAVLNSGGSLGGGTTTAERLAAKGQFGAAANAIASDAATKQGGTTAAPVFGPVAGNAPVPSSSAAFDVNRTTTSAASQPPAASAAQFSAVDPAAEARRANGLPPQPIGPPPQLFLGVALLSGLVAFVAHRRLRRS